MSDHLEAILYQEKRNWPVPGRCPKGSFVLFFPKLGHDGLIYLNGKISLYISHVKQKNSHFKAYSLLNVPVALKLH